MSLFGRIGTQAMKYSFELTVTSLHMSIPLTQPMSVKWTRGPRTATNQPGQQAATAAAGCSRHAHQPAQRITAKAITALVSLDVTLHWLSC